MARATFASSRTHSRGFVRTVEAAARRLPPAAYFILKYGRPSSLSLIS